VTDVAYPVGIVAFFVVMVQGVRLYAHRADFGNGDLQDLPDKVSGDPYRSAIPAEQRSR
jgi:hypothetical protein